MADKDIWELGQQQLEKIDLREEDVKYWKKRLARYQFSTEYPDDIFIWLTCVLALKAVNAGNYGIGCILIDGNRELVAWGHNDVFSPYFRSDRHAEMMVMDTFEDTHKKIDNLDGYTLYTSLESCPMCLTRLITSGIKKVLHAASDNGAGMVHKMKDLPPVWIDLAKRRIYKQASCSRDLIDAAFQIFLINSSELNEKLKKR